MRIMAQSLPFFGALMILGSIHSGVGLNTPVMVILVAHAWLFQVLPAFVVTTFFGFGQMSVWWILALSGVISSSAAYWYYRRGRWLTVRV